MLASSSVHVVEEAPQIAASGVCAPWVGCSRPLPLRETLQDQPAGSTQVPIKLLLLPWVPKHVRILHVPFKSELGFPQTSGTPESKPRWASKPRALGPHLPAAGPPGWGARHGAWTSHSFEL